MTVLRDSLPSLDAFYAPCSDNQGIGVFHTFGSIKAVILVRGTHPTGYGTSYGVVYFNDEA